MTMCVVDQPLTESLFFLYGMPVRYVTTSPFLSAPVNELLRHFRRDSLDEPTSLTLCFQAVQGRAHIPVVISPLARRLASDADRATTDLPYQVFHDDGRLVVDFDDVGMLVIDTVQGRTEGFLIRPEAMPPSLIEYLFHLALIELLRCRGLYTIHATALEKDGCGILIPGNSGRGKTTSFISLLRAGYRYLSDDHPLIRDAGTHVDLLPFPIKINVTDETIAFFPELRNAAETVLHPGFSKRGFYAEKLYPTSIGECCRPALMLFPQVVDAAYSSLEQLPKSRALDMLLPHALLVYDSTAARSQFQVLAKMVQQVDCYRLHFGRNILDLPNLITPLLGRER
jgi:hypothetical protein